MEIIPELVRPRSPVGSGSHPVEIQPRQPVLPVFLCLFIMPNENPRLRVACFVDGFNLYHAIDELRDNRDRPLNFLKWVNLRSLAEKLIVPSKEVITDVYYFSAIADWLPEASARHGVYLKALESVNVHLRLGNFKRKHRKCKNCGDTWIGHEEKESDVNLALQMLNEAWIGSFDKAIVMTADTDIVPAIKMIRERFPEKNIVSAIPEKRFGNALELQQACTSAQRIKQQQIETSLFPASIQLADGTMLSRPPKYTPPMRNAGRRR